MKQNTVKVKERYNWPVTILLIIGIVPSELCRCLGND